MKKVLAAVLAAAMSLSMASVAFADWLEQPAGKEPVAGTSAVTPSLDTIKDETEFSVTGHLYNYDSGEVTVRFALGTVKYRDVDVHVASGDVKVRKAKDGDTHVDIIITPNYKVNDSGLDDWKVTMEVGNKDIFITGDGAYSTIQDVASGEHLRVTKATKDDEDGDDVGCFFRFDEVLDKETRITCDKYVDLYFKGNYDTKIENLRVVRDVPAEVKEYFDDEDVDCYDFIAKPKFATSVRVIIDADKNSIIYEYDKNSGDLTRVETTGYTSDGWEFKTKKLGTYIITEEEYDEGNTKEPAEEPTDEPTDSTDKSNPGTGANDMVGAAAALAVVSLVAAGAVAFKKASK